MLFYSHKLQAQILNQRFDFFVVFRADVSGGFEEGGAMGVYVVGRRVEEVADEPVGDVDVGFAVFGSGVVLEDGADGYMQSWEFRELAGPFFVADDVGKGYCFAAFQDGESGLVELGFAAGGKPGVFGHQAGADDGGLFGFDEGDRLVGGLCRRCSPKRHWVSSQSWGSWPDCFIIECTQVMRPGTVSSLMR